MGHELELCPEAGFAVVGVVGGVVISVQRALFQSTCDEAGSVFFFGALLRFLFYARGGPRPLWCEWDSVRDAS